MADIETIPANTRYFTEVAAPSTPSTGQGVLYAATDGTLHYLNDAASDLQIGSGGGGMTNPMTTAGDVIYSSDGSGTPARLAAGSDGEVLTLASGVPSWAAAAGGGSGQGLVDFASSTRTAGDLSFNGTSWAAATTSHDLVVDASSGDVLEVGLSGRWAGATVNVGLTAFSMVSGSPVNAIMAGGASDLGVQAWIGLNTLDGTSVAVGGSVFYTVQAGDISGGTVTLRLYARTTTADAKTLKADTAAPLQWWVKNLGQPIT